MATLIINERFDTPLSIAFFKENINDAPDIQTNNGKTISANVIPCHGECSNWA